MTRTAVVTGASGGIGSAVVRALQSRSFDVYAVSRTPGPGIHVPLDLAVPFSLPAVLADLMRVDALVHCAGIAPLSPVAGSDPELWQSVLTVNLTSAASLTRQLLPSLRAAAGAVVFVNMAAGTRAVPGWSAYTASKAGLTQLADSLRAEEPSLRVTTVYPAGTATPLLSQVRAGFGRPYDPSAAIQPETLAEYVALAIDAPADAYLSELTVLPAP